MPGTRVDRDKLIKQLEGVDLVRAEVRAAAAQRQREARAEVRRSAGILGALFGALLAPTACSRCSRAIAAHSAEERGACSRALLEAGGR